MPSTDGCYHHYDDFISPKRGLLKSLKQGALRIVRRDKDVVPEMIGQSIRLYLQCYSDAFDDPLKFTNLLCQDISAAIEDIRCKFTHLKDGYSSHMSYGAAEPQNEGSCNKVKSVSFICPLSLSIM